MILWQNDKGEDSRSEEMMNVQEYRREAIGYIQWTQLNFIRA